MRRNLLLLPLMIILLTACRAETIVELDVESDGSGEVGVKIRLDEVAAARAPDLKNQLATEDLQTRGWSVSGPSKSGEFTEYKVSQGFSNVEQAMALIDQIDAETGPIRDIRITQERNFPRVETQFNGTVDLVAGVQAWGDPVLQQRVGSALGFDPDELSRNLGIDATATFPVSVDVDLPGKNSVISPSEQDGRWQLAYGVTNDLAVSSNAYDTRPLGYFAAAGLMLIGAVAIFAVWKPYKPRHSK